MVAPALILLAIAHILSACYLGVQKVNVAKNSAGTKKSRAG